MFFSPGTLAVTLKRELPFSCHAEDFIIFWIFELLILAALLIAALYSFVDITHCTEREVIPARFLVSCLDISTVFLSFLWLLVLCLHGSACRKHASERWQKTRESQEQSVELQDALFLVPKWFSSSLILCMKLQKPDQWREGRIGLVTDRKHFKKHGHLYCPNETQIN
jgi:hypothetical protein